MHQALQPYDVSVDRVQIHCSRLHNHVDPIDEVVNDQSIRPKNINHVNATDQRSLGTRSRARASRVRKSQHVSRSNKGT